ncbi:hypothetical protein PAAG_11441 [Paracoccidioides lutzii Pb01]|uniref:Uncharacterized protein n=1 Tax=Paracoccidioides lutzii (strain ATCC MYA-826 / Pb01) TaxID=502779 RepID=A0A0A2V6X0_PARBA|nr:hypothetical protein PAAG_11441 [Paracoccidioides lutzii Pb01]KGQ01865.1 hypothetical protein PAAG_11441 [Paracoccidioides lutzii Pb01]
MIWNTLVMEVQTQRAPIRSPEQQNDADNEDDEDDDDDDDDSGYGSDSTTAKHDRNLIEHVIGEEACVRAALGAK